VSSPRLGRVPPRPFPGRPGRPRRADKPEPAPPETCTASSAETGSQGRPADAPPAGRRASKAARAAVLGQPRLLASDEAALYVGVSSWTLRSLGAAGIIPRVRVPLPNGGELRKVLYDRADLDRLIEAWKESRP